MQLLRLTARLVGVAVALVFAVMAGAQTAAVKAQLKGMEPPGFPSRPLEFTVGVPPGGSMDTAARLLAKKFEDYTGQHVLVVNKPGAGGMITNAWLVSQASKDGHQIGIIGNSILGDTLLRAEGKWSYRDLDALAFINYEPVVWLSSATGRFKGLTLKKILEQAAREPQSVSVSVLSDTLFENLARQVEDASGTTLNKIPYQGGAASLTALMGDHIDLAFGFYGEFIGFGDRVQPLAVASPEPLPGMPGVPTFNAVLGTDNVQWMVWRYAAVPKGVSEDRKAWLVAAFNAVLSDPELAGQFRKNGAMAERKDLATPDQVRTRLDGMAELERQFYVRTGRLKSADRKP